MSGLEGLEAFNGAVRKTMAGWMAPGGRGRRLYAAWGVLMVVVGIVGLATGRMLLTGLGLGCAALTMLWFTGQRE